MNSKIILIASFQKELKRLAKKYPSIKDDFSALVDIVQTNPQYGISLGKNCFKIRLSIASKGKGKSGGARVITHLVVNLQGDTLYFLTIYDKGEEESIPESRINLLIKLIENT
jgi:hypothetical protein